MFKIKLLILLSISYLITSCINNDGDYKFKMNVAYIGGEYEGLILANQLKSQLNNFNMLDINSQYEVRASIAHSQGLYITNIDNTSDRERVDSSLNVKIFNKELNCITYSNSETVSQFYVLALSEQFISNNTAVEEIKIKNTEYLVKKFVNSLSEEKLDCDEQK